MRNFLQIRTTFNIMKSKLYLSIYFLVLSFFLPLIVNGQGCVAVRQMGGNSMSSPGSYVLPKGEFQIGANYRYFHSWRHFVGREEQPHRQVTGGGFDENGREKGNAVNIYSHSVDVNITYAISDRLQVALIIPYVHNERSQVLKTKVDPNTNQTLEGIRYSVFAQGLSDIRINTGYWIFNPLTAPNGNLMLGAGLKLNTGSHTVKDEGLALDPETNELIHPTVTMDQAIQPGDGGIGFSIELQGFRKLYKSLYGFANAYYLFNPRESNGTSKSVPVKSDYDIYASPDQYFARLGAMISFGAQKNITGSLAGRIEGIPAFDVIGGQVAYRRPGYVVAVEPGISYRYGKHSVSLFVPYNFIKNRVQSAADIHKTEIDRENTLKDPVKYPAKEPAHGDAAFADYSINLSYVYRLGKLF
jgi:hypothetical protein